jgi:ubiquinone/menaquinone biosynthesis C-methylase UbiE
LQISWLDYSSWEVDMKAMRDPEGAEFNHLIKACELTGKNVLEIGCGEGKFTWQYVSMPRRLIGIDPGFADLRTAKKKNNDAKLPYFIQAVGEKLPFPSQVFDIVIFASSL